MFQPCFKTNGSEVTSFTPLFRLLDEFESYSSQGALRVRSGHRGGMPQFTPKFDMRETETMFELHGELPGMTKDNIAIEFTDPQTIVVKGRAERTYEAGTPPSAAIATKPEAASGTGSASPKMHQATVEDAGKNGEEVNEKSAIVHASQKMAEAADGKAKYWHSERSVGVFARTFSFPCLVEQETVSASLRDGILSLTIPKTKKPLVRRISIL